VFVAAPRRCVCGQSRTHLWYAWTEGLFALLDCMFWLFFARIRALRVCLGSFPSWIGMSPISAGLSTTLPDISGRATKSFAACHVHRGILKLIRIHGTAGKRDYAFTIITHDFGPAVTDVEKRRKLAQFLHRAGARYTGASSRQTCIKRTWPGQH
jgi:hypothetical protein